MLKASTAQHASVAGNHASVAGNTVILIHPAWHSCGSHTVFCTQAAAYTALQARVTSLAVGATSRGTNAQRFWSEYYSMTSDLPAVERTHTGPSRISFLASSQRRRAAVRMLVGNHAVQLACRAQLSPTPRPIRQKEKIHLIHCNHYFNMPLAVRLKERTGAPIILDTHDIQAYQFQLSGEKARFTGRSASFGEMLDTELEFLRLADYLVHINADEYEFFRSALPDKRHKLIYPAINVPMHGDDERYFLIVAAGNYGNYESVAWFLDEVAPLCPRITVKIAGTVDGYFAQRRPDLLAKHRGAFLGRVGDLSRLYVDASAILLPTIAGHGLSIKTLEALSTGLPIIAMPLALRGLEMGSGEFPNLHVAQDSEEFAGLMIEQHDADLRSTPGRVKNETRTVGNDIVGSRKHNSLQTISQIAFHRRFSFNAYKRNLLAVVEEIYADLAKPALRFQGESPERYVAEHPLSQCQEAS